MGIKMITKTENDGKSVHVLLNKSFYDIDSINTALKDFKGILKGHAKVIDNNIEISAEIIDKDSKENIEFELCNYILGLIKIKSGGILNE